MVIFLFSIIILLIILKYKFTLGCWRNLFLHTPIYNTICIIYIFFYILSRSILYGFRFLLDICRKVKTVSRTLIFSTSHALGYFIEIISIALATLDKVSLINQLQKLVAVAVYLLCVQPVFSMKPAYFLLAASSSSFRICRS